MYVARNIGGPPVEVGCRLYKDTVPACGNNGGRAIGVGLQIELALIEAEMAQNLGMIGLFHDLESQDLVGHQLRNLLTELNVMRKPALPLRTHGSAAGHRLYRLGQP